MKRAFLAALSFGLFALAAAAAQAEDFKSGTFDPPHMAPDFELQGSNGAPLKLSAFRGKVVVLAFGFTYCERVCPITLANLAQVMKKLDPAQAADVQVIFVTVDPDRDTAARMKEYLAFFNPSFLGATGAAPQLKAVDDAYGVVATREASENQKLGYQMHHSSSIYLIDREGKLRVMVPFGKPPADIVHDLQILLKK